MRTFVQRPNGQSTRKVIIDLVKNIDSDDEGLLVVVLRRHESHHDTEVYGIGIPKTDIMSVLAETAIKFSVGGAGDRMHDNGDGR